MVVMHLPENFADLMPNVKAWQGKIAEQYGTTEPIQYLEGGGEQLVANFGELAKEITRIGEELKKANNDVRLSKVIEGIRVDFFKTNWEDVEKVHGYSKVEESIDNAARTRQLGEEEVQKK